MNIHRLTPDDRPRLREFWAEHWGADFMVVHGQIYRPDQLDGFVAEAGAEWIGVVTFSISNNECEITSLDSLCEGKGIGTLLVNKVLEEARAKDCRRVFLITTNDNLHALGYYQRRGFELSKLHRGALSESRKLKPGIPLIGGNNIPLRDEIELEMILE